MMQIFARNFAQFLVSSPCAARTVILCRRYAEGGKIDFRHTLIIMEVVCFHVRSDISAYACDVLHCPYSILFRVQSYPPPRKSKFFREKNHVILKFYTFLI